MDLRYSVLRYMFVYFLSFSVSAASLTQQDKTILAQLKLDDIEALTQYTFRDLIAQAHNAGKRFALAVVRDASTDKNFFYDLVALFSAIESSKKFENPINRQPIASIRIYLLSSQPHFYEPQGNRLIHRHPSRGLMHLSRKPWLEGDEGDELVGELRTMPQEGFYKYLKNHSIDTTGFIGPYKQYNPTNLPTNVEELRAIVHGNYPLSLETRQAATILLAKILFNNAWSSGTYNPEESENLLQSLIQDQNISLEMWDMAAFNFVGIAAMKIAHISNSLANLDPRLKTIKINEVKHIYSNLIPLLNQLMRQETTLSENMGELLILYLSAQVTMAKPIQNIKATALSIMQNDRINDQIKAFAQLVIKKNYDDIAISLNRNAFNTEEERQWAQQFLITFPQGEIVR